MSVAWGMQIKVVEVRMKRHHAERFIQLLRRQGFDARYLGKNRFRLWSAQGSEGDSLVFSITDTEVNILSATDTFLRFGLRRLRKVTFKEFLLDCYRRALRS